MNTISVGQRFPNFLLSTMGGTMFSLSQCNGKKALLFCWASWHSSRDDLAALQAFYESHRGKAFEVISIAFDVQGTEFPMRHLARADAHFVMLIDSYLLLSRLCGIKSLPCWVFLDEESGVLAQGVEIKDAFSTLEPLFEKRIPSTGETKARSFSQQYRRIEQLMQDCTNLLGRGFRDKAIQRLQEALKLDPENEIIKAQMDVLEQPKKYYNSLQTA